VASTSNDGRGAGSTRVARDTAGPARAAAAPALPRAVRGASAASSARAPGHAPRHYAQSSPPVRSIPTCCATAAPSSSSATTFTPCWRPSVSANIRAQTGLQSDGTQLVDDAFSLKTNMPPLAFNSLQTPSQRSAHSGYAHFARGVVSAFRNPTAHDAKIEFALTENDALDMLATISMVASMSHAPTITPSAPAYAALRSAGS